MNRSIGRRFAGVLCAGGILCLTVAGAAGAVAANPIIINRHYSGHTSQGKGVSVTLREGRISYRTSFSQLCSPVGSIKSGTIDIEHDFDLRKHPRGRFSLTFAQGRTKPTGKGSKNQYFTAIYTASGRIGKQRASGSVSAVSTYHTLQGAVLGTCTTGVLRWSATRTS